MYRINRIITVCVAAVFAVGLTGCAKEQQGRASVDQVQRDQQPAPVAQPKDCLSKISVRRPVDIPADFKMVEGEVPAITAGQNYGENPTVASGSGPEPKTVVRKIIHQGNGVEVQRDVFVRVNYHGQLWSGKAFDSSFDRGTPADFTLDGVIPGWRWGLVGTHVGDRVELVIPGEWGYKNGSGDKIPPMATLVFVVDVIYADNEPSQAELDTVVGELKKSTNTKDVDKLPSGLEIFCGSGQEPQLGYREGSKVPEKPVQVWTKEGTGKVIGNNDRIGYVGVSGSWGDKPAMGWNSDSGVLYAFAKDVPGLVGKKVGSRLVFVGPPNASAPRGIVQVLDIVSSIPVPEK